MYNNIEINENNMFQIKEDRKNKSKKPIELLINKDIPIEKIYDIFPKTENPLDLKITDIGLYSITKKNEAYFITNLITKFFGTNKITITDSTACIGGNTISFQLHEQVKKVNSVEIDSKHFDILKNNIMLYDHNNKVNLIYDNYLNIMKELEQDVVFHDFPWGGTNYKENEKVKLGLYDDNKNFISISNIINELKPYAKMQVLKLPLNFEFMEFFQDIKFNKVKLHKIYNKYTKKLYYYIVILLN